MPNALGFYELMASKLSAEAEMAKSWIDDNHWGAVGTSREAAVRRLLTGYLPDNVVCGTGFVMAENGQLSRQCDLLVYEANVVAPLFREDDFVIVRADAVRLVVEVKSTLNKSVFSTALNNIRSTKRLSPRARGAIFALDVMPRELAGMVAWLEDIANTGLPASAKGTLEPLLPAELVDFVHVASGPQIQAQVQLDDKDTAIVSGGTSDQTDRGIALLRFFDWVLSVTRPQPEPGGSEAPGLWYYLGLSKEELALDEQLKYRTEFRSDPGGVPPTT